MGMRVCGSLAVKLARTKVQVARPALADNLVVVPPPGGDAAVVAPETLIAGGHDVVPGPAGCTEFAREQSAMTHKNACWSGTSLAPSSGPHFNNNLWSIASVQALLFQEIMAPNGDTRGAAACGVPRLLRRKTVGLAVGILDGGSLQWKCLQRRPLRLQALSDAAEKPLDAQLHGGEAGSRFAAVKSGKAAVLLRFPAWLGRHARCRLAQCFHFGYKCRVCIWKRFAGVASIRCPWCA